MKDFLKTYKIKVIIGAYVAIVFAFLYFVCLPIVGRVNEKADGIQQKKIDGELNEKRLADVPAMEENYNRFKDNETSFAVVIEPNSEVELIKELEAMAAQTNNKIELKLQDIVDAKSAARQKGIEGDIKNKLAYSSYLSMKIAIEGDYSSLLNFIHKLENYKKMVNVISVSSEKKELEDSVNNSNPFDMAADAKKKSIGKDVINSILDVVVYTKK